MRHSTLFKNIYRWRVRAGLMGTILAFILSRSTWTFLLAGVAICAVGLLIRTWANGHLRKEKELIVSGPYRHTRNPLYLGNLILGIGVTVGSRSWWVGLVFLVYFIVFYPVTIIIERDRMRELFPEKYIEFSRKVPLFFPSMKPSLKLNINTFRWSLYKKNKEHRTLTATLIFWALMALKMVIVNRFF